MPDVVEVVQVVGAVVEVPASAAYVVEIPVVVGPRGPQGVPGSSGNNTSMAWVQDIPIASWSIPHLLGRIPAVALYLAGELVHADVHATPITVTVAWPAPTAGVAVLT